MRSITILGVFALGVLVPGSAKAQQVLSLTLSDVLERAARFNPQYRQALNNIELSDASRRAAWGAFLPTLNLSLSTGINANRQTTAFDNFGNPIANPMTAWRKTSSTSQNVSGRIDLFSGFSRFHNRRGENRLADARQRSAEGLLLTVTAELRRQYFATLKQSDLLRLEEELLEARGRDLESTLRLFRLAVTGPVDIRAAELEILVQERAVANARSDYQKAVLALRAQIGDPSLHDFTVEGDAPAPFDPATIHVERLVQSALGSSPAILEQRAQVGSEEASLSSARAERWPSLSLAYSGTQSASAAEADAFFDAFPDASRFGGLSFSLNVPIFDGFQTSRNIATADVSLRNAEETLRERGFEVEQNVRSQYIDLTNAWDSYQIAIRSREIAGERLRLANEEYRLAGRSFEELQQAIDAEAGERRAMLDAHFSFLDAFVALEESAGKPIVRALGDGES